MAQSGFTPISIYYSSTASNVPTAANLVPGELAINTADGKLYYEDSSGVVQVLATKSTGSIGGSNTQVQFNSSGSLGGSSGLTWDGSFLTTSSIKNSALTSGRVTYAGASGVLQDSANLVFDGSNLGLGVTPNAWSTTNSTKALQISGRGSIWANVNSTSINNNWYLASGDVDRYIATAAATRYNQNTTGAHEWYNAASGTAGNPITFTQAMTLDASGNLGIGTSSPAGGATKIIDIYGSSSSAVNFHNATSGTTATDGGVVGQYGSDLVLYNYEAGIIQFGTSNAERMRIDSSGNVGIGTSSPTGSLEIATSSVTSIVANSSNATGGWIEYKRSGTAYAYIGNAGALTGSNTDDLAIQAIAGKSLRLQTNGNTTRLLIASTGIVTMSAYGAGAATFDASGVISSVSDETWKTKDGVPTNTDAMLQKLEPGYWFYNEEKAPIFGQDRQLGFYAQNVREAIGEEAAPTPQEGKPWGYYDRSVLAVAVMSLKNALTTIEELKQRITALENK